MQTASSSVPLGTVHTMIVCVDQRSSEESSVLSLVGAAQWMLSGTRSDTEPPRISDGQSQLGVGRIMSTKRKVPGGGAAGANGVPGNKRKVRFQKKGEGEGETIQLTCSQLLIYCT